MGQYQASKLAAHTATLEHISDKKPNYSIVTIHPVFVFGENLSQTTAEELGGTNAALFGSLYSKEPIFTAYRGVHVLDVAEAHIRALSLDDAPIARVGLGRRFWILRIASSLRLASRRSPDRETCGLLIRLVPKLILGLRSGGKWKSRLGTWFSSSLSSAAASLIYA
jgi:nucleoside-diphosphate-sugar epimerase